MGEFTIKRLNGREFQIHSGTPQDEPHINPREIDALCIDASALGELDLTQMQKLVENAQNSTQTGALVKGLLKSGKPIVFLSTTMDLERPEDKQKYMEYLHEQQGTNKTVGFFAGIGVAADQLILLGKKRGLAREEKVAGMGGEGNKMRELETERKGVTRRQALGGIVAAVVGAPFLTLDRMLGRSLSRANQEVEQRNALLARAVESAQEQTGAKKIAVILPELHRGMHKQLYAPSGTDAFKNGENFAIAIVKKDAGQ